MNDEPPPHPAAGDWLQPLVAFWGPYFATADEATRRLLLAAPGSDAAPDARRRWLAAASSCIDAYLRSPGFLRALRQNVAVLVRRGQTPRAVDNRDEQKSTSGTDAADRPVSPPPGAPSSLLDLMLQTQQVFTRQALAAWERLAGGAAGVRAGGGATPADVVFERGTLQLLRYRHASPPRYREPVVLCCSLVNRPQIVDLVAERSVARQLLRRGLDVYLVDWGVPTAGDRTLRLADYVCRTLPEVVAAACRHSRAAAVNLLGYCMGGTMATMFAALYPARVRNLILLAAPVDFSGDESLLNVWARPENFDVDGLIDALGNCPGELLQSCFQLLKPVQNFVEKYLTLSAKRDERGFLENFFALERWANDSVPVAGETFREFVKALYQHNRLARGEMRLAQTLVDLARITCPLLLLTADFDHLVAPAATLALRTLVSSADIAAMSISAGHIGLAVSSQAHRRLWPAAADWIAERSTVTGC